MNHKQLRLMSSFIGSGAISTKRYPIITSRLDHSHIKKSGARPMTLKIKVSHDRRETKDGPCALIIGPQETSFQRLLLDWANEWFAALTTKSCCLKEHLITVNICLVTAQQLSQNE